MINNTTVIIANYLHPHFTKECVESVKKYYPNIPMVIVDDCSPDIPYFEIPLIHFIHLPYHMGHGIALDYGVEEAKTKYVITLDHDTALVKEGAFEYLFSHMTNEYIAGVGKHKNNRTDMPFLNPNFALWRADLIKRYKLSFDEVVLSDKHGNSIMFAVAQLLSNKLEKKFGYDLFTGIGDSYIKQIGVAKYPVTQNDYKIKRI